MAFQLIWESGRVIKKFSGDVSGAEFIRATEQVMGDSRYDSLMCIVNDFTEATLHGITEETVTHYAAITIGASFTRRGIRVLFVGDDPAVHSFARALRGHGTVAGGYQTRVFRSLEAAESWHSAVSDSVHAPQRSAPS